MKILILSDAHGNLPSLEKVLKKEKSVDLIISLGDVVNYGPWSNECVDLLETTKNTVLLMGNHEESFLSGEYQGKNKVAKSFFNHCFPDFSRKKNIQKYVNKFTYLGSDFTHTINNRYIYPDSEINISNNFFIGHSHRIFSKDINGYRLVNVGSVGQNRVNIDEINYVIWDTKKDVVELVREHFPADQLINEMKIKNYPTICLKYIMSKRN